MYTYNSHSVSFPSFLNLIYYSRALEVAPDHTNTLYNFAVMLDTHCSRKEEAELLYRRCLELDPKHPYALYNLAVLCEEKGKDLQEVLSLYTRAVQADPQDPTTLADYGRFVASVAW